jgi:hypothetical protein
MRGGGFLGFVSARPRRWQRFVLDFARTAPTSSGSSQGQHLRSWRWAILAIFVLRLSATPSVTWHRCFSAPIVVLYLLAATIAWWRDRILAKRADGQPTISVARRAMTSGLGPRRSFRRVSRTSRGNPRVEMFRGNLSFDLDPFQLRRHRARTWGQRCSSRPRRVRPRHKWPNSPCSRHAGTTREGVTTAPMKALSNQKFQGSSPSTARTR